MAATLTADGELTYASFPIEKIEQTEDGNVLVWGKATDGSVDSDAQIVDPDFAAKAMDDFFGSGPNIRVQHQANRDPAGVGVSYERDGDAHWLKSKIIEPVAKQLVLGGALRAYSVGIARPTIQRDSVARGGRITDGQFVEISLVDRPANKNCGIQLVKAAADGQAEWVGKVFGSDDMIAKALGQVSVPSDVTITFPSDVQMSFSPLDMAKIIARKNGGANGFLAKAGTRYEGGVPTAAATMAEDGADEDEGGEEKAKLTSEARNALPDSAFVFPDKRAYPIHDRSHARNALARASGKPEEGRVRAAVGAKYPGLPAKHDKKMAKMAAKAALAVANEATPDMTKPVRKTDSDSDGKTKSMCTGCGAKQNSEHTFCTECGNSMASAMPVQKNHDFACLGCGKDLDKGEKFCPGCGKANPGHNPMADLKIPANKAADTKEGSRVADKPDGTDAALETPDILAKKKKAKGDRVATKPGQMPGEDEGSYSAKGKGKKGKPFGGNQAAPFGGDKDDDDAKKVNDAPLTAPKGEGLGGPASGAINVNTDLPGRKKKRKRAKDIQTSTTPASGVPGGGSAESVPGHRSAPEDQVFDRDMAAKFEADPAGTTVMRLKSLGMTPDMGYAHDLVCPAFDWQAVSKAYPMGMSDFSADAWQQKALEAASSAPLAEAQAASQLGQAAFTIKSAAPSDLIDVKNDLNKAFRDANPGPSTFPTPGEICATRFQRPKITSGLAAYSHQYEGPNSAKIPSGSLAASSFGRAPLTAGMSDYSPANKGAGAPYPSETGVHMNLDYSSIHKANVLQAFKAMHDHFDRVFPGVCPMNQGGAPVADHPVDTAKADETAEITKKVTPDGMSKKQRKKLKIKLTKKVMAGKMPLDQARIRMGKKPKTSPAPLKPQKGAAEPEISKAMTLSQKDIAKAFAVELRKARKTDSKKIADLTKAVNALADQPDPATQAFKGMALDHPLRKSARPAGVQEVAANAERAQAMILNELKAQWRNTADPAVREPLWNKIMKMEGWLPEGS